MLRSADNKNRDGNTPLKSKIGGLADTDLAELASLIGSLDIDLNNTAVKDRSHAQNNDPRNEVCVIILLKMTNANIPPICTTFFCKFNRTEASIRVLPL